MENTLENKAKLFAQYWGQEVANVKRPHEEIYREKVSEISINHIISLELTPLHLITDEDAIHVAQLMTRFKWNLEFGTKVIKEDNQIRIYYDGNQYGFKHTTTIYDDFFGRNYTGEPIQPLSGDVFDFLRSKGYALPFNGLSVSEQVERGWVVLKTKI